MSLRFAAPWVRRLLPLLILCLAACVNAPPESRLANRDAIRFVGRSGIATANGIFHRWRVLEARVDRDDPSASFALIEIDVASLDTDFPRRDDHLRDPDFFDVERWPTARVRVEGVRPSPAGSEPPRYRAHFDVAIRDRRLSLPGEFAVVSERPLVVEGGLVLDRVAFGIGAPDCWWNPLSPRNEVPVRFRVTLAPPAPEPSDL